MDAKHEKYLLELTGLPTATGHEDHVLAWIERWARRRRTVDLSRDRYGNVLLKRAGARSRKPILFTAHMDHPAFVVTDQIGPRRLLADFRGGVQDAYFTDARVRLHLGGIEPCRGRVVRLDPPKPPALDKRATIELVRPVVAEAGDVLTWDLPAPKITRGRLHAPACDDLAGVAAALAAFDVLLKGKQTKARPDVRVLLTRAEEVGFIGAIGACKSGIIPKAARLIALETSRSFADSPIGGGPIVRVGDRTSSFDPDLTYRVGQVAQHIQQKDAGFDWQRKLMTGGTCEASAYQAFGFTATCLCLPLGNYHNMKPAEETKPGRAANGTSGRVRIDSEIISLADYHGLIRLLIETGRRLDIKGASPTLKDRLDPHFARRRALLNR
jgi:putative aminopeptidase FrvX